MHTLTAEERRAATAARDLLYSQLPSRALVVAVTLGIPEMLSGRTLPITEIASGTGADPAALTRLLRGLAVYGVFTEPSELVFGLAPVGAALTRDHPASAAPSAELIAADFGTAWDALRTTVTTGASPFPTPLFDHLETPAAARLRADFDASQRHGLVLELDEILRLVDFSAYRTVVDVGGGDGAFLKAVLRNYPDAVGTVFDLPGSVAPLPRADADLAGRYATTPGDFFDSVPPGGDLYLLSHVIHDWDDDRSVAILTTCRRAMGPDATLMVVDLGAAEPGETDERLRSAAFMDLYMMSLFGASGGRERTPSQVRTLLGKAGLRHTGTTALPSGMHVFTAVTSGG